MSAEVPSWVSYSAGIGTRLLSRPIWKTSQSARLVWSAKTSLSFGSTTARTACWTSSARIAARPSRTGSRSPKASAAATTVGCSRRMASASSSRRSLRNRRSAIGSRPAPTRFRNWAASCGVTSDRARCPNCPALTSSPGLTSGATPAGRCCRSTSCRSWGMPSTRLTSNGFMGAMLTSFGRAKAWRRRSPSAVGT